MARTFNQFVNRTRSVSVFPDDPDALTVKYRPEVFNDDFRRMQNAMLRSQRGRERSIAALSRQIGRCEDEDERDHLEDEHDRLKAEHEDQTARESADYLARVIAEWDLYDDEHPDQLMPTTSESLAKLGGPTLKHIIDRIMADMNPNPTNGINSANGSPAVVNEAPLSTGSFAS